MKNDGEPPVESWFRGFSVIFVFSVYRHTYIYMYITHTYIDVSINIYIYIYISVSVCSVSLKRERVVHVDVHATKFSAQTKSPRQDAIGLTQRC